ncbi:Phytosulfokine [Artemisia annua]|uniref:Phytosulfokine n=1 Tax=Artemisia annua TaxID=35608 RepID=A0A2U1MGA5_ARTAN|nr:Phytosulfokine [Artemisia annua]
MEWNDLVMWYSELYNGDSIGSVIRRIGLAASVYLICQERNWRLFRDVQRSANELFCQFSEIVKMRLLSLKVKASRAVSQVQKEWEITLDTVDKISGTNN